MNFTSGNVYHVFNQGNNREILFRQHDDYIIFLGEIRKLILPHCEILAYCLMPNHFHLMIYTDDRIINFIRQGGLFLDPVTNGFRKLLSGYARIANKKYNRTGSLFRQKTRYKLLTEESIVVRSVLDENEYCVNCFHYIHQNPWKAGLTGKPEDWEYSSFKDYAGIRNGTLCNKMLATRFCFYNPEDFMKVSYAEIGEEFNFD